MNKQSSTQTTTILVIVLGLLVLSFIFKAEILVKIATGIGILALVFPVIGQWIEFIWMKIAEVLGWINTRVLLGVVFFIVLFPISILYRLTSKDLLRLKKPQGSVFFSRDHIYSKEDFENIW